MKKMMNVFVLVIIFMFIITISHGQEKGTLKIPLSPGNIPETYIIKKGDTLWDLSEMFLGNPFEWPSIWKKNDYIKDPHWIYPGQTLTFMSPVEKLVTVSSPPPLKPLKQPEPLFIQSAPRITEAKPEAKTVSSPSITTPSSDNREIIHELDTPRPVYTEKSYIRTGFITQQSELPKNKVIVIEDNTLNATRFDIVTIDAGTRDGVKEGISFASLALGDRVKHPDTGKNLGVVVRVTGILKVISVGEERARCQVAENFSPIAENDLVMPFRILRGPMFDAWVKPEVPIKATILAINEPMLSIHIDDILYIDKGSENGVQPGDRFVIYSRKDEANATGHREPLGELEAVNVMST
ncbi:MAG TPA: LysM peptidoglycan-binding domain-containing protein, partial [Anaerolineae bacterium]|nr:LysM peptidoglycan-binding domain-containing protein [Anaerolineae bacterium]